MRNRRWYLHWYNTIVGNKCRKTSNFYKKFHLFFCWCLRKLQDLKHIQEQSIKKRRRGFLLSVVFATDVSFCRRSSVHLENSCWKASCDCRQVFISSAKPYHKFIELSKSKFYRHTGSCNTLLSVVSRKVSEPSDSIFKILNSFFPPPVISTWTCGFLALLWRKKRLAFAQVNATL